jgi:hypothetical protein
MFEWLLSLDGIYLSSAKKYCDFVPVPQSQFANLASLLKEEKEAVACVSTGFVHNGQPCSHVVNVWFDGNSFCLRDSNLTDNALVDTKDSDLLRVIDSSSFRGNPDWQILHGLVVTNGIS